MPTRMIDHSLFGLKYASGIQVYYLTLAWTLFAALAMFFLTQTPLGPDGECDPRQFRARAVHGL